MNPTDQQLNDWAGRLWQLKNEMEVDAWVTTPETHQPDYVSLVHLAWKAVHAEAHARRDAIADAL